MAFPTTSVLDDFNRSNQGPPLTGWSTVYNGHKVVSNQCVGNASADANVSTWGGTFGNDQEAYVTLAETNNFVQLYVRMHATNNTGYAASLTLSDSVEIWKVDDAGSDETRLGAVITLTGGNVFAAGDSFGVEIIGTTIKAYRKPSGGSWTEIGSRTDSTYSAGTKLWLFTYSTKAVDDFGGGTVSGGAYTLTAAQGSHAVTGQAAGLLFGRRLTAAQGSHAVTGQAAGLLFGRRLTAAQGAYVLAGQAVTLTYDGSTYRLTAAQGSHTLTGQAAALRADRTIAAAQGTHTLTGQAAALLFGYLVTAGQGTHTLTGQAAALGVARYIAAAQGTHTLTGQAIALLLARYILAAQGTYTLTGRAVVLVYSGDTFTTPADRVYTIDAEIRTLIVAAELRTYIVDGETRVYSVRGD